MRILLLLFLSATLAACELVGDIFQAGFAVGLLVVVIVLALIFWLLGRFRRRGNP